jgi:mRNA-degrading endonuclease RelE of RelBE toxin-antitoxin system
MDALGKLLKRASRKDQESLLALMRAIKDPSTRKLLDIKKLSDSEHFRARKGNFRIIFHIENGKVITDSVRFRNEKTYRDI